jgi:hypothetical protein
MNQAVRTMRMLRLGFFVFGLLIVFLTIKLPVHSTRPANGPLEVSLGLVGVMELAFGWAARSFLSRMTRSRIGGISAEVRARQWMAWNVLSLAFFMGCLLIGFVLHSAGSRSLVPYFLIGMGLISMLVWRPGTPPGGDAVSIS